MMKKYQVSPAYISLAILCISLTRCEGFINSNPSTTRTLNLATNRGEYYSLLRHANKNNNFNNKDPRTFPQTAATKLKSVPNAIGNILPEIAQSLFRYHGRVPVSQAFALNAFLFAILRSKLLKMLTPTGYCHSLVLGTVLWSCLGWRGWTTCVLYLFLGSIVTKVKFEEKEELGIAEGRGGRRGPENVWGSAATGLMCALCFAQGPQYLGIESGTYALGYVASLATKLSDTFASEIGKAYGKTTFLITTLERVKPGTEGAVSAEGTAASILGGTLISMYGLLIGLISARAVPISIFAAFVATNIESVLGATLQGKKNLEWITNEVVNFINTLIGAAIAIVGGMTFL